MSGSVVGMHFVCRDSLNVTELPDGTIETGVWVVAKQHLTTVKYVALHESKAEHSYRQGRVVGTRTVIHEGRKRTIFRVVPERIPLPWVGDGSGEKGYRYAEPELSSKSR